jgi:hypothetical protein
VVLTVMNFHGGRLNFLFEEKDRLLTVEGNWSVTFLCDFFIIFDLFFF